MTGYVQNIEQIKVWFDGIGKPKWNLYHGFTAKHSQNYIYRQTEDIDVNASWELLQSMLEMHGGTGGKLTLSIIDAYGGNQTAKTYYWSGAPAPVNHHKVAGLSGYSPQVGMIPAGEAKRREEDAVKLALLERDLEDLKAAQHSTESWSDVVRGLTAEVDVNSLLAGFIGMLNKQPVTIQGLASEQQPVTPQQPEPDPTEEEPGYQYDWDRLLVVLDQMMKHHDSTDDLINNWQKIANRLDENPGLLKMIA